MDTVMTGALQGVLLSILKATLLEEYLIGGFIHFVGFFLLFMTGSTVQYNCWLGFFVRDESHSKC